MKAEGVSKVSEEALEHPCSELEASMRLLFAAFDDYQAEPNGETLNLLTARIDELRFVGRAIISGEPEVRCSEGGRK